jgi:hypothetical protein
MAAWLAWCCVFFQKTAVRQPFFKKRKRDVLGASRFFLKKTPCRSVPPLLRGAIFFKKKEPDTALGTRGVDPTRSSASQKPKGRTPIPPDVPTFAAHFSQTVPVVRMTRGHPTVVWPGKTHFITDD